jgi:hypothetical protein
VSLRDPVGVFFVILATVSRRHASLTEIRSRISGIGTGRGTGRGRGASGTGTNPVGATAGAVTIDTTARDVIVIEAGRGGLPRAFIAPSF